MAMKVRKQSSNGGSRNIRFALIVFIGLVVFCMAQLTWWIVFQMDLSKRLYDYRVGLLEYRIDAVTAEVNNDFRRVADFARYAFSRPDLTVEDVRGCIGSLLSDPAVIGLHGPFGDGGGMELFGQADSTFYSQAGSEAVIYFNTAYPRQILPGAGGELIFSPGTDGHSGEGGRWIRSDMFALSPDLLAEMAGDARGHTLMFITEGGFFVLIMLFGAFLIYRTLRKSEELNLRQVGFVQAVTHEFRTPLTSLRLYLETLQSGTVKAEEAQQVYDKMLDDCDRLDGMIDNVLEAGYFHRRKYQLKLSETDLRQDLQEYLEGLEPYIKRQGGRLNIDLEDAVFRARTDYQALGRAVRALIENAARYSPRDKREITVRLTRRDGKAAIAVADRGPGIPSEEKDRIFERFYRINDDRSRRIRGTGLGLYLVRHIVEAHGGKVAVDSPGKDGGSTFTIELPLAGS